MMRAIVNTRLKWAVLALLLAALGAGAATAVSAHGGDASKIHGCVNQSSGSVRIVGANETCLPSEEPLDWNIQGLAGATGAQGATGPRGPSDGYVTSFVSVKDLSSTHTLATRVLSLTLPAGDYLVSASVFVARHLAGTSSASCAIRVAGGAVGKAYAEHLEGADDRATIAMVGVAPLASEGIVAVDCDAIGDAGTSVQLADLTAIRVETLTRQ